MLDKFLNKINSSSVQESVSQRIQEYNRQVIIEREIKAKEAPVVTSRQHIPEYYNPSKFSNFQKNGQNAGGQKFQRPNTYQTPQREFKPKEYIDDGSYFCSYSTGGNTLVCYKNKEKVEFILDGITHPDKNNYLAKRANYFLNDLVKKKKVFLEEKESGHYEAFLDIDKKESINVLLINEGYHNSQPYNPESKDKKTSFSKNKSEDSKDSEEKVEVKEKKNYAYGLFATNHNTFEALFNKEKITLKLDGLDSISKENQKICKSMIYDFVSKKSIVLKFIKEENGVHFVEVFNKEGECLNNLIADKKFPNIEANPEIEDKDSPSKETSVSTEETNEQCSEDDWNWTSDSSNSTGSDIDTPEVTNLPAMFKKPVSSNPNSPFAKKKILATEVQKTQSNSPEVYIDEDKAGDEVNVPEITNLPAIFKKPVSSNPNSPFAKKKISEPIIPTSVIESENSVEQSTSNSVNDTPIKKKLSFGKR